MADLRPSPSLSPPSACLVAGARPDVVQVIQPTTAPATVTTTTLHVDHSHVPSDHATASTVTTFRAAGGGLAVTSTTLPRVVVPRPRQRQRQRQRQPFPRRRRPHQRRRRPTRPRAVDRSSATPTRCACASALHAPSPSWSLRASRSRSRCRAGSPRRRPHRADRPPSRSMAAPRRASRRFAFRQVPRGPPSGGSSPRETPPLRARHRGRPRARRDRGGPRRPVAGLRADVVDSARGPITYVVVVGADRVGLRHMERVASRGRLRQLRTCRAPTGPLGWAAVRVATLVLVIAPFLDGRGLRSGRAAAAPRPARRPRLECWIRCVTCRRVTYANGGHRGRDGSVSRRAVGTGLDAPALAATSRRAWRSRAPLVSTTTASTQRSRCSEQATCPPALAAVAGALAASGRLEGCVHVVIERGEARARRHELAIRP